MQHQEEMGQYGTKEALVPRIGPNLAELKWVESRRGGAISDKVSFGRGSMNWAPPTMTMVLAMVTATMAGKEKPNERWTYRLHGG